MQFINAHRMMLKSTATNMNSDYYRVCTTGQKPEPLAVDASWLERFFSELAPRSSTPSFETVGKLMANR
jgi:hypothetical protein